MARYTLIFGNGLGRSLDNDYFKLSSGLEYAWNESEHFTDDQKTLVISAIRGIDNDEYPSSEEQLDILQVAIVAAGFLKAFESEEVEWLNNASRELPQAFRRFIHEVASYFHKSGEHLNSEFIEPLSSFIRKTASHVAVLNYDNLLYDALVKTRVLNGYHDTLIDGFHKSGFASDNLNRLYPDKQSWYMHLHGSPLYIGNNKLMRDQRTFLSPTEKSHIVLTHVEHKPLIIESSSILSEYWKRLGIALKESERVILFGYSGCDTHLNEVISTRLVSKNVVIIEREGEHSEEERLAYWGDKLPEMDIKLIQVANILNFQDWWNI